MNWYTKDTEELFDAILALETNDEAKFFFRDLLTEGEITEFGKRWKTARLLESNTSYSQIAKETGMSSTTIARISKWLNQGMGGDKTALGKTSAHHGHHHSHPIGKE